MRKNKSVIRQYWELKKRLRLMTLSILIIVSSSLFLLSNSSLNFNLHFAWGLIPYVFSFFMANFVLNKEFSGAQTRHISRFVLRFFTAKRMIRPLLMNIIFVVVLLGLFIFFGFHSGIEKIDIFFDTIPFVMVVGLGAVMRPDILCTRHERFNNFDPSFDSHIEEEEHFNGVSDSSDLTSIFNPANPASALNIANPFHPSNM